MGRTPWPGETGSVTSPDLPHLRPTVLRRVFGPLAAAVSRTQIPCVIDVPAGEDAIANVSVRRAAGSALPIKQVSGPDSCGMADAFYMTRGPQGMRVSLCPAACAATSAADVELRIAHTCQGLSRAPGPSSSR